MQLRRKLTWIAILYVAEGFPFGIAYDVWPVYFRVHGVSLREIGLMSLLFLPYTLKAAWAPLVDRLGPAAVDRRLPARARRALPRAPRPRSSRPGQSSGGALRLHRALGHPGHLDRRLRGGRLHPQDSGFINGMQVSFYRGALIFAGGLLLLLADLPAIGWRGVWLLAAGICAAAASSPSRARRCRGRRPARTRRRRTAPASAAGGSRSSPPRSCLRSSPTGAAGRGSGSRSR